MGLCANAGVLAQGELKERLARSERLYSGAEALKIDPTGEEGVRQMRALLGLGDL